MQPLKPVTRFYLLSSSFSKCLLHFPSQLQFSWSLCINSMTLHEWTPSSAIVFSCNRQTKLQTITKVLLAKARTKLLEITSGIKTWELEHSFFFPCRGTKSLRKGWMDDAFEPILFLQKTRVFKEFNSLSHQKHQLNKYHTCSSRWWKVLHFSP